MTQTETKLMVLDALYNRGVYMKRVNEKQYRTRCPFCGDSIKTKNTGHLYIKIDMSDDSPIVFHCFKCDASGVLSEKNIENFDIKDDDLIQNLTKLNKSASNYKKRIVFDENKICYFDYKIPEIKRSEKSKYIEDRLGLSLSDDDLKNIKFIPSIKDFLELNNLNTNLTSFNINMLEKYYVGFLSFGNSHILFRDVSNTQKIKWLKYPITKKSTQNRIFYSTQLSISYLETTPININLAEGIMDILSVKYNLDHNTDSDINIAASGKSYDKILDFMISNCFYGSNVTVNIYSDNDIEYNKNGAETTLEWFNEKIGKYKPLFKAIYIYYNIIGKDVGVPKDKIILQKNKL